MTSTTPDAKALPSKVSEELEAVIAHKWWHPHGQPENISVKVRDISPFVEKIAALESSAESLDALEAAIKHLEFKYLQRGEEWDYGFQFARDEILHLIAEAKAQKEPKEMKA